MTRPIRALLLVLAIFFLAGCAPPQDIAATLTMLPGTPTPRRPTRTPTPPAALGTLPTAETPLPEATLYTPATCPTGAYSSAAPEDASLLVGLSYNLSRLPPDFDLQDQQPLSDGQFRLVHVRWQGRSLYWIDKLVCRNENGVPYWVIVDALPLPRLDPQANEAETSLCFAGGKPIPNVVAYGIFDPNLPYTTLPGGRRGRLLDLHSAWKIAETFSPLAASDLQCYVNASP